MATDSLKVKKSLNIRPSDNPTLDQVGDLGVDSADSNRLKYNTGTGAQRVLLAEDAGDIGFTDASNVDYDNSASGLEGENLQETTDELAELVDAAQSAADDAQQDIDDHIAQAVGAHAASAISVIPAGNLAAEEVQAALEELQGDIDGRQPVGDYITELTGDVTASGPGSVVATISGLDASKIADGSVSNAEFQALDGVTSGIQGQLDGKQDQDPNLDALAALTGAGVVARQADNSFALRSIEGTEDEIVVSNGDGSAEPISVSLAENAVLPGTAGITIPEGGTAARPPAPTANVIRFNTDTNSYEGYQNGSWRPIGGGGVGGLNLLVLSDTWEPTESDNSNAEISLGRWAAYADAAGTAPEDMTGGSPSVTISRVTSAGDVLNGVASFSMDLPTASSHQGEGVSCLVYVPEGYRGRTVAFTAPFIANGTLVEDDIKLYAYDVTNSVLITPYSPNKVLGERGKFLATFSIPSDCEELRVGLHVARTSTDALEILFDDVNLSPEIPATGLAGSSTGPIEISFENFGTPSQNTASGLRYSDRLKVTGQVVPGSVPGSPLAIILPSGHSVDIQKFGSAPKRVGTIRRLHDSTASPSTSQGPWDLWVDPSEPTKIFANAQPSSGNYSKQNADNYSTSNVVVYEFDIPIAGWDANVTMGQSNQFRISSYLANGTRITGGDPTALSAYRSQLRNTSATTYTDTNGAPAVAPSATNGIALYRMQNWAGSAVSGQPSRYDIFVGKNKNVKWEFYSGTGRTGNIDITPNNAGGSTGLGYFTSYDPTTGVATIWGNITNTGGLTTHYAGIDKDGVFLSTSPIYFDILVSEDARAVGIEAPRSSVEVHTANGRGSIGTTVRRYSSVRVNVGTAIIYTDSPTNGATFEIKEDGVYAISMTDGADNATNQSFAGIVKNPPDLTIGILNISNTYRLNFGWTNLSGGQAIASATYTGFLRAGDIIKPFLETSGTVTVPEYSIFNITQVSRG